MLYLDMALRGGTIAILFLLAILMLRARIGWEGRLSVLAVAISKTGYLLINSAVAPDLPAPVLANLTLLASLTPNAITWLIVTIFLDAPHRRWPWFVASSIASAAFYLHMVAPGAYDLLCLLTAVALYGGLLILSLWSARGDLVDCRCRARPGFAAAIAGLALVLTGVQALGLLEAGSLALKLLSSGGVFVVACAFALWLLRADDDIWPGHTHESPPQPAASEPHRRDGALISRIEAAMAEGIWREEGLTIGALATRLAVPEHRLRRAINSDLGHRNFSSFINRERIAAAKAQLADPALCGKTVLEIAYDGGFASLGPFNRAFRAETGQSPTEYRRDASDLSPPADSENVTPIRVNLH